MHAPSLRVSGGLEVVFCDMQVFVQFSCGFHFLGHWWMDGGYSFSPGNQDDDCGIYTSTLREGYP